MTTATTSAPAAGPCPLCCGPLISQRELRPARLRRGNRAARSGDVVRFVLLQRPKAAGNSNGKAPGVFEPQSPLPPSSSEGRATRVDGKEERRRDPAAAFTTTPPSYGLFNRETPVSDVSWLWRAQGAALGEALAAEAEYAAGHGHSLLAQAARAALAAAAARAAAWAERRESLLPMTPPIGGGGGGGSAAAAAAAEEGEAADSAEVAGAAAAEAVRTAAAAVAEERRRSAAAAAAARAAEESAFPPLPSVVARMTISSSEEGGEREKKRKKKAEAEEAAGEVGATPTPDDNSSPSSSASSPSSSSSSSSHSSNCWFFYQAEDGSPLFLSSLDARVLSAAAGGFARQPPLLEARVLSVEPLVDVSFSPSSSSSSSAFPHLSHVPRSASGSSGVLLASLDFEWLASRGKLSKEALLPFAKELRARDARRAAAARRRAAARAAEEASERAARRAEEALRRGGPNAVELAAMPRLGEEERGGGGGRERRFAESDDDNDGNGDSGGGKSPSSSPTATLSATSPVPGVSFASMTRHGFAASGPAPGSDPSRGGGGRASDLRRRRRRREPGAGGGRRPRRRPRRQGLSLLTRLRYHPLLSLPLAAEVAGRRGSGRKARPFSRRRRSGRITE